MAALAMILWGVGAVLGAVGGIWILVLAFKKHVGWGIGCLLVPGLSLIFALMNLKDGAAKPLVISIIGGVLFGVAVAVAPKPEIEYDADGNPIVPTMMMEEPMTPVTPPAP